MSCSARQLLFRAGAGKSKVTSKGFTIIPCSVSIIINLEPSTILYFLLILTGIVCRHFLVTKLYGKY
ncbi:MAG: hypothetical protein FGF51_06670 [Candidatus Brockarchaeota archaeon]|nr:hypothetical protein [Candidatus Brockarchaeota archaeon]